jgi:hypothetical protein
LVNKFVYIIVNLQLERNFRNGKSFKRPPKGTPGSV